MNRQRAARHGCRRLWPGVLFWLVLIALPGAAYAQTERVTGDWQQFVLVDDAWRALGIYRVAQTEGDYRMAPVSQSQEPVTTPSKGLSNVRFAGAEWSFNSDWGDGKVGEFRLRHIGPGVYVGWSYLRDQQVNLNLWVLVR
jgi:hypothetical protein